MFVRDIMNKDLISIDANESIKNACNLYREKKIGSILVTENSRVVGIITERDIIERTICDDKDPNIVPIKEIMTKNVKTVNADDRVNHAVNILKENNIKKLPVTDKGELVGIITVTDIALTRPDANFQKLFNTS